MFTTNLKKVVSGRKKRIGRGAGSGKGMHTVGRGQKGQSSRSGFHAKKAFEGGAVRLVKRVPHIRGFKSLNRNKSITINIARILDKGIFEIDATVVYAFANDTNVKLVGADSYEGYDLSKVTIKNDVPATKALRAKVTASGGTVEA